MIRFLNGRRLDKMTPGSLPTEPFYYFYAECIFKPSAGALRWGTDLQPRGTQRPIGYSSFQDPNQMHWMGKLVLLQHWQSPAIQKAIRMHWVMQPADWMQWGNRAARLVVVRGRASSPFSQMDGWWLKPPLHCFNEERAESSWKSRWDLAFSPPLHGSFLISLPTQDPLSAWICVHTLVLPLHVFSFLVHVENFIFPPLFHILFVFAVPLRTNNQFVLLFTL